ncbi:MAG: tol-pal system protein YbgF [Nitrospirota bacterium]
MLRKFKTQSSRFKIVTYLLLFTVHSFLFGCATTADLEALRNDVDYLKGEISGQEKKSSEIRRDLEDLKKKTDTLKKEELNALRESLSELNSRLSDISKDLQLLTGRFDENKYSLEKELKDSISQMEQIKSQATFMEGQTKEIRDRLGALENQIKQAREAGKIEESKKEAQEEISQTPKLAEPQDKMAIYESAYDAFQKKKYKEAREKFETFLKEFPQDELADNAQFWLAEIYYNQKDFESAILAYETLLKKYPNSEKALAALKKQGLSFIEIGDRKTGKVILERLIERYPTSKEAGEAKKKIEEMEKKTGKKKK